MSAIGLVLGGAIIRVAFVGRSQQLSIKSHRNGSIGKGREGVREGRSTRRGGGEGGGGVGYGNGWLSHITVMLKTSGSMRKSVAVPMVRECHTCILKIIRWCRANRFLASRSESQHSSQNALTCCVLLEEKLVRLSPWSLPITFISSPKITTKNPQSITSPGVVHKLVVRYVCPFAAQNGERVISNQPRNFLLGKWVVMSFIQTTISIQFGLK